MAAEAVVIYARGAGYATGSDTRPFVDNVEHALRLPNVDFALAHIQFCLLSEADDFDVMYVSAARAMDDQQYEAERQEML